MAARVSAADAQMIFKTLGVKPVDKNWISAQVKWRDGVGAERVDDVIAFFVSLTPSDAGRIVSTKNADNRHMRDGKTREYALSRISGSWIFTGDPIVFSGDGDLLNGQHRLASFAISASDAAETFMFVVGVPREASSRMDRPIVRNNADALAAHGCAWSTDRSSVVGLIFKRDNRSFDTNRVVNPKGEEAVALEVAHHDDIDASLDFVAGLDREWKNIGRGLPRPLAAFVLMELSKRHSTLAKYFVYRVVTGYGLSPGDPISHVRSKLQNDIKATDRYALRERLRILAIGWNSFLRTKSTAGLLFKGNSTSDALDNLSNPTENGRSVARLRVDEAEAWAAEHLNAIIKRGRERKDRAIRHRREIAQDKNGRHTERLKLGLDRKLEAVG